MPESIRPVFSRDLAEAGDDDHTLREGPRSQTLIRLRRGAYVDAGFWGASGRDDRYLAKIRSVVGTRQSRVVLSHHSAARMWGLPMPDGWPPVVHIVEPPDSARRSRNGVRVHRSELTDADVAEIDGVLVTSLVRTLVDLAADAAFYEAITAIDAALDRRAPRVTRRELQTALDERDRMRASRRAQRALDFATDLSESVGESWSRGLIADLGFPAPVLQYVIITASGPRRLDFGWPGYGVAGEMDGRVKYLEDPVGTVWREKVRENELRDAGVRSVARWGFPELREEERLYRRLVVAGLPSTRGTPRRRR